MRRRGVRLYVVFYALPHSPQDHRDASLYTSDSVFPSQDLDDVDEDVNAAPVSRSRSRSKARPARNYTFPEMADLTNQEMSSWSKEKRTAFVERCLIGPEVVFKCAVPKSDGQPCGEEFTRREISKARDHFRSRHFPKTLSEKEVVRCPWPGCEVQCAYRATGRHFEDHAEISCKCPFCPQDPISRSDSFFRHLRENQKCKRMRARRGPQPPTPARSDGECTCICLRGFTCLTSSVATVQPEAGPSTQRKRPPQTRARAQPEAGPSQGRKRSHRCVEEEEEENIQEEDVEVDDDDDDDDPAWVPNRKGKGKGKAKVNEPARKRQKR